MATIQIRNVPEDAYKVLRRRARAAGQSLQAYMREHVIDWSRRQTVDEAWDAVEAVMAAEDTPGSTLDQIVRDIREDRGQ